jgi:hypothetical protein
VTQAPPLQLCRCGCGRSVSRPGWKYIAGHKARQSHRRLLDLTPSPDTTTEGVCDELRQTRQQLKHLDAKVQALIVTIHELKQSNHKAMALITKLLDDPEARHHARAIERDHFITQKVFRDQR